ncbi:MAG: ArsO family NAD(P)H-dependent flavin-containing monooxygenase [Rubrobacteraceae bacterium]
MVDVAVIGAGQAGLALGYYLRRSSLSYVILDMEAEPGGAWRHGWDSLRAFSPARWSSLPGWLMDGGPDEYPTRDEVIEYFRKYEERYGLPIERPMNVRGVRRGEDGFAIETDGGDFSALAVVSATGTLRSPHVPEYPGRGVFGGRQLHSSEHRRPEEFEGERVLVVGGGNSGAQIMAEVSRFADATWVTACEPKFLPDDVDGRVLFERATEKYKAKSEGRPEPPAANLADIVVVSPVKEARERGDLENVRSFERFTKDGVVWPDGTEERVDAVVWATGFGSALSHLEALSVVDERGHVEVEGTRSVEEPGLWLVGYGEWTGFASATVIGVGRTARATAREIEGVFEAESSEEAARASP